MEDNLYYVMTQTKNYLNLGRDISRINSKNEEITTRDGHVYGYMVECTAIAGDVVTAYCAPNSWKMRNSFRKFHAYRDLMFDNAGVEGDEKGRYGKTIRPYLDQGHFAGNKLVPATVDSAGTDVNLDGGEWTYTQLATTPIYTDGPRPSTSIESWADSFPLHICEENIEGSPGDESTSGTYDSVGMIHSYNLDRMEIVTPVEAEALASPSNPLAALRSTGNQATGEVLDIAIDQELEAPPYDIADNGDSIQTVINSLRASTAEVPTMRWSMFVPAGLARIEVVTPGAGVALQVRVLGKVLCKDLA